MFNSQNWEKNFETKLEGMRESWEMIMQWCLGVFIGLENFEEEKLFQVENFSIVSVFGKLPNKFSNIDYWIKRKRLQKIDFCSNSKIERRSLKLGNKEWEKVERWLCNGV